MASRVLLNNGVDYLFFGGSKAAPASAAPALSQASLAVILEKIAKSAAPAAAPIPSGAAEAAAAIPAAAIPAAAIPALAAVAIAVPPPGFLVIRLALARSRGEFLPLGPEALLGITTASVSTSSSSSSSSTAAAVTPSSSNFSGRTRGQITSASSACAFSGDDHKD